MNRHYSAISGLAIVLIIVNHAVHFGLQMSTLEGPWVAPFTVLQAFGTFAVPTFLFVSGAFLAYAAAGLSIAFLRGSCERILVPYVVWSIAFYALAAAASGDVRSPAAYLKSLLVGFPYHFVPLLTFWYVAAPLLVSVGKKHGIVLVTIVAAFQVLLIAVRHPAVVGLPVAPGWARALAPPVLFTTMADWAVYLPLGFVLSLHGSRAKVRLVRVRPLAVIATLVLFVLGFADVFGLLTAPWARFAVPVPAMLVLPTLDRSSIPFVRSLEYVGRRSYGIYLSHFVLLNLVLLPASGLRLEGPVTLLAATVVLFVLGLGLPLLLMHVLTRASTGRRVFRPLFGIAPPFA